MVKKITVSGLLLLGILGLFSDEFNSKVSVSSESVGVNETFQLDVEVFDSGRLQFQGIKSHDESVSLSQVGVGSRQIFQNGVTTSSQIFTFYASISKAGKYTIGPFLFKVKDRVYETDEINVNVISLNGSNNSNNVNSQKKADGDFHDLDPLDKKNSNYILRIFSDKKEAYVNEPVVLTVKFYKRNDLQMIKAGTLNLPSNSWIENTYNPNDSYAGITRINDMQYQEYVTEQKRVFISRDSVYAITPVEFQFYGYYGNDMFAQPENITIKSNSISIKIKPLPQNPPEGFDGAVGTFKFTSSIDKTNCKLKEPVNLKITLEGKGNFQNIKDASYKMNGSFEIYSSKSDLSVNGDNSVKIWDILAVPEKSGEWKIKVKDFVYFDLLKKEYVKLKGNEYIVRVGSDAGKKNEESVIINSDNMEKLERANYDIGNIKTVMGHNNKIFNYNLWFVIIILIYLMLTACLVMFLSTRILVFNRYVHRDEIIRKNSYKTFIRKIGGLREQLKKNNTEGVMNSIYAIAENYFKSKFCMESIEFTNSGIQQNLGKHLDTVEIEELKNIFVKIDMQRFGGIDLSSWEIDDMINRISDLVKSVESRDNL